MVAAKRIGGGDGGVKVGECVKTSPHEIQERGVRPQKLNLEESKGI